MDYQHILYTKAVLTLTLNRPEALSNLAHTSHLPWRDDLFAATREGGMRAFLEQRDGPFSPELFGPKST